MKKSLLKNSSTILVVTIILFSALLCGCSKKEAQNPVIPAATEPAKVSPKPVQSPMSSTAKVTSATDAQFDFSTKKDPFKPYIVPKPSTPVAAAISAKHSLPIHSYDVSQFRVIGIVTGGKTSQAMVVDPSGKGYVLKVGMTIGKNEGRVTDINNRGIEVLEQFKDDNGRVRKEHIKITLPRKE